MEKRKRNSRFRVKAVITAMMVILSAVPVGAAGRQSAGASERLSAGVSAGVSAELFAGVSAGAGLVSQQAEMPVREGNIWDRIKEKMPDIDFSEMDLQSEKEKLREAIETMDELGISPERLVQRTWDFLNRKDNKERLDQAVEGIRDKFRDLTGEKDSEDSQSGKNDAADAISEEAEKVADQVVEEVTEQASEKIDEATEQAKEQASEKIDEAAEQVKEQVKKKAAEEIEDAF